VVKKSRVPVLPEMEQAARKCAETDAILVGLLGLRPKARG